MSKPNDEHRRMDLNGHSHLLNGATPNVPGPEFRVVQLRASEKIWGTICSPAVWGVVTHWDAYAGNKGRSSRCTKDKLETCKGCDLELPTRWKGYVHFVDHATKKEAFLELTPAAFDSLIGQAPTKGTLRGLRVAAERTKGGNQGRLLLRLDPPLGDLDALPPARDPEPTLELLWAWRPPIRQA